MGGQFAVGVALVAEVDARARAPLCSGHGAGFLRRGQHDGRADRDRAGADGAGRRHRALPGAGSFWPARCRRRWPWWSSRSSRSRSSGSRRAPKRSAWARSPSSSPIPRWRRNSICRPAAGVCRRGGAVGHRLLQLRSVPPGAGKDLPRAGPDRRGAGRQDHHLDRRHFAAAELRRLLRRLRLHLPDALHQPAQGVRRQLPGGHGDDRVHVLEPEAASATCSG